MTQPYKPAQNAAASAAPRSARLVAAVAPPPGLSLSQVESSYRRYAPIYDWVFGPTLGPGRVAMTKLVSGLAPQRILEIGVGTGLTLAQYPTQARVTGIDVSKEMLASARQRVAAADQERIDLRVMDAEHMDFADASFDCVTLPYVLSVTPHPERMVAEVRRVCRPGGDIVIVGHFSGQPLWRLLEAPLRPLAGWLGFRTDFDFEQHVLRHSWKVLSVQPTNMFALSRLIHIRNE
jgi:phosphatidylethanolamine/phosphatidyl-N-methylethanolamine N-methyltransferase